MIELILILNKIWRLYEMKFKMRSLQYAKGHGADTVASAIQKAQAIPKLDRIPPDYPLENEKLVFVCVDAGKKLDDAVKSFISLSLNPSRVKNVALLVVSPNGDAAMSEMKAAAKSAGVTVAGDLTITVKGGLFKKGSVSDADVKKAVDWAGKLVDSLAV